MLVVLLLLIHCLLLALFGGCDWTLFCYAVLSILTIFAIIWMSYREMVALRWLFWCIVTIIVLWLFLTVPWVDLQCVLVVFPGHTH